MVNVLFSRLSCIYQEFAVAGRPGDRAFRDAGDMPAGLRPEPGRDPLANGAVDRRIAHDPALADLLWTSLELRFDQCDERRVLGGQRQGPREHGLEPDKARAPGHET